ncbi:fructose 1,6-bisphosphatase [Thiohalorhabdus denitrificans]|uniref:Fructose-1,6-bisphosphatase n=1 Tax=Thiohalorhabdus denitrificans TaxID=381306 RepID=A0A0P9ESA3_9GAMM|nr:class II fructose-bisphosphatase [Thiohalorhabdus denitrificans]KPV41480.1 fructose 1,6-bisphosphatase [Thiohalorhabdus denitrificans]SCY28948.1 fructose-1,6-bisphosphatase II [Thiohalorhabdus denitrificans]
MPMEKLTMPLVRTTEAAARGAVDWIGRGEKEQGDGAAVEAMRQAMTSVPMAGEVVIGEGEKDEAPMLYNGEQVGDGDGPRIDIAVDPVEGTNFLAKGMPGSIVVLAAAPHGQMFRPGPGFYMDKLVVPPAAKGQLDPEAPLASKLGDLASALDKKVEDLRIFVLDKPRHQDMIRDIRAAGASVRLASDGDVSGGVMAALGESVDALMGIGGTPEGVITACAAKAVGGDMFGAMAPQKEDEEQQVREFGLEPGQVLTMDDLIKGDNVLFVATGLTNSDILDGVQDYGDIVATDSMVITGAQGTVQRIRTEKPVEG